MESEPHSGGGETWDRADFRMWYNLDLSFPEPATYFDVNFNLIFLNFKYLLKFWFVLKVKTFLPDLLTKPYVEFENKEPSPLVKIFKINKYQFCS